MRSEGEGLSPARRASDRVPEYVGIAFWRKDLCETHAKQILAKAEALGITIFRD